VLFTATATIIDLCAVRRPYLGRLDTDELEAMAGDPSRRSPSMVLARLAWRRQTK